jgi:hypothetical protein
MDNNELDDDPYERYAKRRRLMESLLGEYGSDRLRATRSYQGALGSAPVVVDGLGVKF